MAGKVREPPAVVLSVDFGAKPPELKNSAGKPASEVDDASGKERDGHLRIKDLSNNLRPRERLEALGAEALSTAELIAILLGSGFKGRNVLDVAHRLLKNHGSLENLARASVRQLMREKGIGQAKAVALAAAFGLGRRLKREAVLRPKVRTPAEIYDLVGEEMRALSKEVVRVILLNTRLECLRIEDIAKGSVNESVAHPRDILMPLFTHSAHSFVLVHNHPSGDPTPSEADRRLTRRLADAAALLQVNMLDHVIIGSPDGFRLPYFSFKEAGFL